MPDGFDFINLAIEVAEAARNAGAVTEVHRRPAGEAVITCRLETAGESRYFEIIVELDGFLSMMWAAGGQVVRVTKLKLPPREG